MTNTVSPGLVSILKIPHLYEEICSHLSEEGMKNISLACKDILAIYNNFKDYSKTFSNLKKKSLTNSWNEKAEKDLGPILKYYREKGDLISYNSLIEFNGSQNFLDSELFKEALVDAARSGDLDIVKAFIKCKELQEIPEGELEAKLHRSQVMVMKKLYSV